MKYSKSEIKEARERLTGILKPGDSIQSIVRHVSSSGMSRNIDFYVMKEGGLVYLTHSIAVLLGYPKDKNGALKIRGCGMDMCFAVVYELGHALWPKGIRKPHGTRNGEPDSDGGYALKSETI